MHMIAWDLLCILLFELYSASSCLNFAMYLFELYCMSYCLNFTVHLIVWTVQCIWLLELHYASDYLKCTIGPYIASDSLNLKVHLIAWTLQSILIIALIADCLNFTMQFIAFNLLLYCIWLFSGIGCSNFFSWLVYVQGHSLFQAVSHCVSQLVLLLLSLHFLQINIIVYTNNQRGNICLSF